MIFRSRQQISFDTVFVKCWDWIVVLLCSCSNRSMILTEKITPFNAIEYFCPCDFPYAHTIKLNELGMNSSNCSQKHKPESWLTQNVRTRDTSLLLDCLSLKKQITTARSSGPTDIRAFTVLPLTTRSERVPSGH